MPLNELPLATALIFLFSVVWCLFWALVATGSRVFIIILAVLGATHWILADAGFYMDSRSVPPVQLLVLLPTLLALAGLSAMASGRKWMAGAAPVALVMVHVARIPVELTLHSAYLHGAVPRGMTFLGHNFDILSGISAAFLAAWMLGRKPPGRHVLIAWNVICLALLAIVVVTAVRNIPSSIQTLNFDQPNVLVTRTPYILLPALIVPVVLWAHVAALFGLFGKHQR